jgi:glycosyltransferase involved in cell wall biosynthesis
VFNIVHSHDYKALLHLSFFRSEIPALLATYHGATSHTVAVQIYEFVERILFQSTDCVVAVSDGARATLESRGPFRSRIAVVPNFVSCTRPKQKTPRIRKPGEFQLLFLGRLSYEKGLDVLLRAIEVSAALPIVLDVVGDGPERASLEAMAQSLKIAHKVKFHGFERNVMKHLSNADILVMPSRTEAMPMALMEAATLGIPIVASSVGGIPEIITHLENGVLVDPADACALSDAIETVTADMPAFKKRSAKAAKIISKRFSAEGWVRGAVDAYTRALQSGSETNVRRT